MIIDEDMPSKGDRRGREAICSMMGSKSRSYFLVDAQELSTAEEMYHGLTDRAYMRRIWGLASALYETRSTPTATDSQYLERTQTQDSFDPPMSAKIKREYLYITRKELKRKKELYIKLRKT